MEGDSKGPIILGRYALFDAIASGGMATVHLARLMGEVGFSRTVAIKRLHSQHATDPDFVSMFIDEARLAARVRHPNVVQTLDVGATDGELFVVMDYIEGESLSRMFRLAMETGVRTDERIVSRLMIDTLQGLHAAHDAKGEDGAPLEIVHRDVSPQNVLVGTDGISRVLDFGIAKAAGRGQVTRDGEIKGKLSYMAPEQLLGMPVTRRTDVFAAGIVLWELLCGRRLFAGGSEGEVIRRVIDMPIPKVTVLVPELSEQLALVVARALERDVNTRFQSAVEFADALDAAVPPATARTVAEWIRSRADETLSRRAQLVAHIEKSSTKGRTPQEARMGSVATLSEEIHIPVDVATAHATSRSVSTVARPSRGKWVAAGVIASVVALGGGGVLIASRARAPALAKTSAAPPAAPTVEAAPASAPLTITPLGSAPDPQPDAPPASASAPTKRAAPVASTRPGSRPASADAKPTTNAAAASAKPAGGLYTRD